MNKIVAVTGITGHTGGFLLKEFIRNHFEGCLRCLVRPSSNTFDLDHSGLNVEKVVGSVEDEEILASLVRGTDVVFHIVGIRFSNLLTKIVLQEKVKRRLSYIKPGQNIWQAENVPPELMIKTRTKISQIYRKLDPDKPSYTVTAAGGGGTFMYHWSEEQRELTNRERARIQTFPDDFEFVGKYSSVRKQIGMAVPPRGAEIIFRAILNTFAGIEYPYVEPSMK